MNKAIENISPAALDLLIRHDWPGNVRELENAIERAMVVGQPPSIKPDDLPFQLLEEKVEVDDYSLAASEKRHIAIVLEKTSGNIKRAAELLKIDRVTLYNKIKKYGLRPKG